MVIGGIYLFCFFYTHTLVCGGSLLDSIVEILQHVLVKVFISIHSLQIFLELLFEESKNKWRS